MLTHDDINFLINEGKFFSVTENDISNLEERLTVFDNKNKPLTLDYNLMYTL